MSVTDPKAICFELAKWSAEEVGFSSSQTDLKQLSTIILPACKGSAMMGLWNEVIRRVKSKKVAGEIKSNLALEKMINIGENKSAEIDERKREFKSLEKDIEFVELQLQKHKEDLQEINLKKEIEEELDKTQKMKGYLLQNYGNYLHLKTSELKLFQKWLDELSNVYKKDETELSEEKLLLCSQEVEGLCVHLEDVLNSVSRTDRDKHNSLGIPWQSIGELMKEFHPSLIISSLQHLTDLSTSKLQTEEKAFDTVAELERLETTIDTSAEGDNDQDFEHDHSASVQNMLQKFDLECVKIYTQYLVSKRNADNMIKQSEIEQNSITVEYQKYYELAPSTLQLAIDNLESEIKLVSFQGCLRSFQSSVARLTNEIHKKTQAYNRLIELKSEIDGFSVKLEANQDKIITITKHNSAIKSRLPHHQMQALNVADSTVCQRRAEIAKCCDDLLTAIQRKYKAMGQSDLTKLRRLKLENGDHVPLCQLSLNRYRDTSPVAGGLAYCKSAHFLLIHYHMPPSGLMERVIDDKHEVSAAEDLQSNEVNLKHISDKSKQLSDLTSSATTTHKLHTESVKSKYENGLKKVELALQQSQALSDMVKTWYDQPAQYQTPWLKIGELTLEECKHRLENVKP